MKVRVLVDFEAFWASLAEDVRAAERSVLVETFSFEGDRIGLRLADAMLQSPAADRRILADSFSRVVLSDRFLYAPGHWFNQQLRDEVAATKAMHRDLERGGVAVRHGNPFGPSPRRLLRRNHKKLIVIDRRVAYIGGINFSEHNASWHDMMLRIDDAEAAGFLADDFDAAWQGRSAAAMKTLPGLALHALNGRANAAAFETVLRLIDGAERSITVCSPYVTFPFYDRLRDARRRGVAVTIITPRANNWNHFSDYARWESARGAIELRFFNGGMSHLKAMLIDDRCLVAGSSNFDFLSYRIYEELLAVVTAPEVIADFRSQVLTVDLLNSTRVEDQSARIESGWSRLRLRLLTKSLTMLLE